MAVLGWASLFLCSCCTYISNVLHFSMLPNRNYHKCSQQHRQIKISQSKARHLKTVINRNVRSCTLTFSYTANYHQRKWFEGTLKNTLRKLLSVSTGYERHKIIVFFTCSRTPHLQVFVSIYNLNHNHVYISGSNVYDMQRRNAYSILIITSNIH